MSIQVKISKTGSILIGDTIGPDGKHFGEVAQTNMESGSSGQAWQTQFRDRGITTKSECYLTDNNYSLLLGLFMKRAIKIILQETYEHISG